MPSSFKPLLIIFCAVAILASISLYRGSHQPDEAVAWGSDYKLAQAKSKEQNKPMLLYFTASWCGPCQEMKKTTFADDAVNTAIQKVAIPVRLDVDENPALARDFFIESIPAFFLISPDGQIIRKTSAYQSKGAFLSWLEGK